MSNENQSNRYPGVASFTRDQNLFFLETDVQRLET